MTFGISKSFRAQTFEQDFYAPTGALYSPPNITRVVRGAVSGVTQLHNPGSFSSFQPGTGTGRVVPGVCRRLDDQAAAAIGFRWITGVLPAFVGPYNYHTSPLIVLRPNVFAVVASAIVGGYSVAAPNAEFPAAGVLIPKPRFLFSSDGGESYTETDLSYMMSGGDNAWKMPSSALAASAAGRNFHMTWLRNRYFVSLVAPIDTGVSTFTLEPRLFVGTDLASLTRVNSPPNYGTVWSNPGRMLIDPSHGRIAYCLTNISSTSFDQFSKSNDGGITWTAEPLPWPSHMCGFPEQIKEGTLEIMVMEGPPFGNVLVDITLWRSTDFGTTWKRIATVMRKVPMTTATQGSFLSRLNYLTRGSFPSADAESYRFDNRVAVPTFKIKP